jgi:hypothetical protein
MATSRVKTSSILQGFPKSRSLLSGNAAFIPNSYESISTVTVGSGGSSSITFSSIPATFTHLQLRCLAKNTTAGSGDQAYQIAFNSDTTYTNYRTHYLQGEGSAAYSGGAQVSGLYAVIGQAPKAGSTSVFGVSVTDILDYTNTSKNKITRTLDGDDMNGSGAVNLRSALWLNTSAINRIDITLYAGLTFAEYSKFALYGIKGA